MSRSVDRCQVEVEQGLTSHHTKHIIGHAVDGFFTVLGCHESLLAVA